MNTLSNTFKSRNRPVSLGKQRGAATLTDLLLTGGLIIGIIAFIFVLYNYAWPYFKAWRASTVQLANMSSVNSAYNGASSFASLTTAGVAQQNIIDLKFLPGGGVISNYYGGSETYAPATLNGVSNNTQSVTDTGVPRKACLYHVNMLADAVDTITVGGTSVKAFGAALDTNAAIAQCNTGDYLTIVTGRIKQS